MRRFEGLFEPTARVRSRVQEGWLVQEARRDFPIGAFTEAQEPEAGCGLLFGG
jgi:hypothetical protein